LERRNEFKDAFMNWRSFLIFAFSLVAISGCSGSGGLSTHQDANAAERAYARGDYTTALREWKVRAIEGDAEAQYGLGYMYRNGQGVPKDNKEAEKWYGKAASQGNVKAQIKLGLMNAKGDGIPRNYIEAHKWFNIAAGQGHNDAARARDKITQNMTAAELEEALRLAREWKPSG
jgi:TPR repeat protein